MTDVERHARNVAKLNELWPPFSVKVAAVIRDLESPPHNLRPRIQEAWRSPADQLRAYLSGHSHLKYGLHNVTGAHGRKEALAADILDDDEPLDPRRVYLVKLCAAARTHGLDTGIDWNLPLRLRAAVDRAVGERNWSFTGKIGFDPTHVQVNFSPLLARLGMRPKL